MAPPPVRFPNKILVTGIVLILVGVVLLLWTLGFLPAFSALWPVLPVGAGLVFLYMALLREGRESNLFIGMILLLGGGLFLLLNTVLPTLAISRIWPVFMTVTGVSLYAYGLQKHGHRRISLVIPAATIILLSLVFLPFSLNAVEADFKSVVITWWPVLFIVMGAVLLWLHVWREKRRRE
jgi:drug/metabolite transporter (DMT)-like permease